MYTYPYVDFFMLNTAEKRIIHKKVKNLVLDGKATKNVVVRFENGYKVVELNAHHLDTLKIIFNG